MSQRRGHIAAGDTLLLFLLLDAAGILRLFGGFPGLRSRAV